MSKGHDLSNIRYTGGGNHRGTKVAIVVSKWNDPITFALRDGAIKLLKEAGVKERNIKVYEVPGSYELPYAAQKCLEYRPMLDGVIALGCVIQGETRHFDFICDAVANGLMKVSLQFSKPAIFGVLTPDTMDQAKARAGGRYGNKGEEAAVALLELVDLKKNLTWGRSSEVI
ncbi:MAG: 6,7-dimethyl-8-ribityllumazine synthase [Bacteroidota bacterium]